MKEISNHFIAITLVAIVVAVSICIAYVPFSLFSLLGLLFCVALVIIYFIVLFQQIQEHVKQSENRYYKRGLEDSVSLFRNLSKYSSKDVKIKNHKTGQKYTTTLGSLFSKEIRERIMKL